MGMKMDHGREQHRNQVLGGAASRGPSYSSGLPTFELGATSLACPARTIITEKLNGRMDTLPVIQAQRSTAQWSHLN